MKANEFREMSQEQLTLTLKDLQDSLFRLRFQSQTEKLEAPSEIRKSRRDIARIKTILSERRRGAEPVSVSEETPAPQQVPALAEVSVPSDVNSAEEQHD